ncbi:MAG: hypothetical protein ACTHK7_12995 [Aureliella sp.]
MPLQKNLKRLALLSIIACGLPARPAQAGPLFDWLFGIHHKQPAPAYAVGYAPVVTGYAPVVAGYAPVVTNYAAAMPVAPSYTTGYTPSLGYSALRPALAAVAPAAVIAAPTTPVSVVPDYRTTVSRTPVTYYRPLLTTDATTGSQQIAMAPCSSYEYQTQRVPILGGTQSYYGSTTLPATTSVAPAVTPTVVLPSGGVALAGPAVGTQPYATAYSTYPPTSSVITQAAPTVSAIAPAVPAYATTPSTPYSAGYSAYAQNPANYSALQPSVTAVPPATTYPTVPSGGCTGSPTTSYYGGGSTGSASTSYYGSSTGGGSTGSYIAPSQPMTTIPSTTPYSQAPYGTTPGVPSTGTAPVLPPTTVPGTVPSTDPASQQPTLPLSIPSARLDSKPQLQSVVRQPIPGTRSTVDASSTAPARDPKANGKLGPGLLPIPVPEDFKHEPRWNPGLLNEQDQTAANTAGEQAQSLVAANQDPNAAWGSKPIHWASFKEPLDSQLKAEPASQSQPAGLELSPPQSRLRDLHTGNANAPRATIAQPELQAARDQERAAAQVVLPSNVQMVPLEEALKQAPAAPSSQPQAGEHLMLSPSSGALSIEPARPNIAAPSIAAPSVASPATRSRYSTDGWQRAR